MAPFTKEVNPLLAKLSLKTNGRLTNRRLASLVKEVAEMFHENQENGIVGTVPKK